MATKSLFPHDKWTKLQKVCAFLLFYCKITYIISNLELSEIIVFSFCVKEQKRAKRAFALFLFSFKNKKKKNSTPTSYQTCLQGRKKDKFSNIKEIGKIKIIKKIKKKLFLYFLQRLSKIYS